jgi:hypothetical protein
MSESDKNLLKQMIHAGLFNEGLINLLQQKQKEDTKQMVEMMGTKYCLHPSNSPVKGTYGI